MFVFFFSLSFNDKWNTQSLKVIQSYIVHKAKTINKVSELTVDIWKQSHDIDNNLSETFYREHAIKETAKTKYLGCMLSNDGTNTKSMKMKVNKVIRTRTTIKTLIKHLGKYTIESGILYFKSLLRGSLLYATESMVNIKLIMSNS